MTGAFNNRQLHFGVFSGLFILALSIAIAMQWYYLALVPFIFLFIYAGWQSRNFIFFLLMISVPLSVEYRFSEMLGTDFPDEFLMITVSFFFGCYWLYRPPVLPAQVIKHPLVIVLLLSLCWSGFSALFSTTPLISLKYLLAKSWYLGAFVLAPLILFGGKKIIRKAIAGIVVPMVIITIIVMLRHLKEGLSFAGVNDAVHPFFRNHVTYSALLVCILPVVFVYGRTLLSMRLRVISFLILLALVTALYFSYARGAWLALVMGMVAAWLIQRKLLLAIYITAMVLLIASLFWLKSEDRYLRYAHDYKTTIWHKDFREHLVATYRLKDVSTAERFYRWVAGVRMIKDRWLTGFGPNSFYNNYQPYTIPAFKTWVSNNKEHSTVHNYFLLVAIEQGIPGLFIFLLLAGMLLYYAQYLYHRIDDRFYKTTAITTGVVVVMILVVNFLSDLIETDKIGSLFFLCLSLLVAADTRSRQSNPSTNVERIP